MAVALDPDMTGRLVEQARVVYVSILSTSLHARRYDAVDRELACAVLSRDSGSISGAHLCLTLPIAK